jgi:4-amino-4-deoxy-L-arabinose transferase-like glycosyltransferase
MRASRVVDFISVKHLLRRDGLLHAPDRSIARARDDARLLAHAIPFQQAALVAATCGREADAGWDATRQIWTGDSAARFENLRTADVLKHLTTYPFEVLGCTAPWSFFLSAFLSRRFRGQLADIRPQSTFLAIYFVLGFLPCWVSPGGMTRYCLPLYPALALLIGSAAQGITAAALSPSLRRAWTLGWKAYTAPVPLEP